MGGGNKNSNEKSKKESGGASTVTRDAIKSYLFGFTSGIVARASENNKETLTKLSNNQDLKLFLPKVVGYLQREIDKTSKELSTKTINNPIFNETKSSEYKKKKAATVPVGAGSSYTKPNIPSYLRVKEPIEIVHEYVVSTLKKLGYEEDETREFAKQFVINKKKKIEDSSSKVRRANYNKMPIEFIDRLLKEDIVSGYVLEYASSKLGFEESVAEDFVNVFKEQHREEIAKAGIAKFAKNKNGNIDFLDVLINGKDKKEEKKPEAKVRSNTKEKIAYFEALSASLSKEDAANFVASYSDEIAANSSMGGNAELIARYLKEKSASEASKSNGSKPVAEEVKIEASKEAVIAPPSGEFTVTEVTGRGLPKRSDSPPIGLVKHRPDPYGLLRREDAIIRASSVSVTVSV